jgi:hypothetical protein
MKIERVVKSKERGTLLLGGSERRPGISVMSEDLGITASNVNPQVVTGTLLKLYTFHYWMRSGLRLQMPIWKSRDGQLG